MTGWWNQKPASGEQVEYHHYLLKRFIVVAFSLVLIVVAILDFIMVHQTWYTIIVNVLIILAGITGIIGAIRLHVTFLGIFLLALLILCLLQIATLIYRGVEGVQVQSWGYGIALAAMLLLGAIVTADLRKSVRDDIVKNKGVDPRAHTTPALPSHARTTSPTPQPVRTTSPIPQHTRTTSPIPQHTTTTSPVPQHTHTTSPIPQFHRQSAAEQYPPPPLPENHTQSTDNNTTHTATFVPQTQTSPNRYRSAYTTGSDETSELERYSKSHTSAYGSGRV